MDYRPPRMDIVNFRLDRERIRALDMEAEERRMTRSALIREIILRRRARVWGAER